MRKTKNNIGYVPKPTNIVKLQTYLTNSKPVADPKVKKKR